MELILFWNNFMAIVGKELPELGNVVSLYTGAGGMDIGFHKAGFNIIWANDIDKNATATYKNIFPNHEIRTGSLLDQELPKSNHTDLVIGGPPCQGFSVAGKMDPNDPRSQHVWNFLGVVNKTDPRVFVMENVKALAVNNRWKDLLERLRKEAKKMGYQTKVLLLNSADYNVPQARERMFLIGTKEGMIKTPKAISSDNRISVNYALSKIPKFGTSGNDSLCTAKITPAKNPILRKSPYAGMLFNGQGRPLNLKLPALTLPASMGGNRTPIVDQNAIEDETITPWVETYHERLLNGGKSLKNAPKFLRRITVEEASVLQTFPVEMKFEGTQSSRFRQIGNAVPPELAFHVAKSIKPLLA
ncbi:DNA cytosine methyltransferase [Flagellimonas pacifica]|uniref:Cytosine-specific methyltransferase n=1 Tax=Flagellimonas pacifica TaxID=1247520 RepID=A0A285N1U5_9FLAO|nr:DNA cytosine methyltransferase [Allomuricauda parva]SNZ01711.1 DNA (cytosine-5)-methyltransferase 1 [Allomuricauda parva]